MFLFKKIAYLFILALNFVINYAIVCTLVSFVLDIVRPELPWLQELILRLGLPYTVQTRILVLGFLVVVIPCLFSHTGIMERYCCWTLGGRRPARRSAPTWTSSWTPCAAWPANGARTTACTFSKWTS